MVRLRLLAPLVPVARVRLPSTARRAGGPLRRRPARRLVLPRDGAEYRPDASGTAKGQGGGEDESEEEVDLRLYCICRQLYDDRFMLGCEKCVWCLLLTVVFGNLHADRTL